MRRPGSKTLPALLFGVLLTAHTMTFPQDVNAWGSVGHRVLARVAASRLSTHTRQEVKTLLGGRSLAAVSTLPDEWRKTTRPETAHWHFVDIPKSETTYDPTRDCQNGDCAIEAIARQQAILADHSKTKQARTEALIFLVHLVGDVHQPLHCADDHDRGGNDVQVKFFGIDENLHAVWDSSLIEKANLSETAYVHKLNSWLSSQSVTDLQSGTVTDWALEAHQIAREHAYGDMPASKRLGAKYFKRALPFVDEQLAKAGVRLAKILNETLS
jgi:hypothetical protein